MGNKHTHTIEYRPQVKTQYKTDPALQVKIDHLQAENKKFVDEVRKLNDPNAMVELREKQQQNYLKFIKSQKWTDGVKNEHGVKHNVVVGNISVGKSSLLNTFFNLKLQVGIDETTMSAEPVRKGKVTIWDSPGINQDFDLYSAKTLSLFVQADKIFILFNTSLKSTPNQVKILNAANPNNLYAIRTQCDKYTGEDALNQALNKDKAVLQGWGINASVFATSAHNQNYRDNKVVKMLMDS